MNSKLFTQWLILPFRKPIPRSWREESRLLHPQHDKLFGASIPVTSSFCISLDLCWSLYPCTHLALTNLIDRGHLRIDVHFQCGVFRPWPQESTVCLHISDPSGTFLKILQEVTPCWELNLNLEQQNGWVVTEMSTSFEQTSFIYRSPAVCGGHSSDLTWPVKA